MFRRFQRLLPKISETERIALQSGRRSIEGDIFQGKKSQVLTTLNYPVISNDCKKAMDKYVRPLCNSLNNYSITQKGGLSEDQINKCRPLFGLGIPPESGGLGLNRHDQSQIVQTVASRSVAAGVTVMVPNSLGPAELIHHYGTDSQRATLLPDLAEGKLIPCFGLTGTYSGSDAASMRDTGRVYKTDSGLRIKLNCEKRYITLAPLADIIGIAFNLEDPDNLIPSGKSGITLALLSRDTNGLEIGSRHHPLNAYFHNGPFRGTDLDFPITQVVGGIDGVGNGWKMLMECLVEGRGISLPASAISGMKLATLYASAYGKLREQFRRPIADMQGVQEHLAEMIYHTYVSTASQYLYNSLADNHHISSTLSAILKYSTTERGRTTINHSMDVLGGIGICDGPRNLVANIYGATPVSITVEGSNTLTRSLMIYGQGLLRGHPHLLNLEKHLQEGEENLFWKEFFQTLKFGVGTTSICTIENIFLPEWLSSSTHSRTNRLLRRFTNVVNIGLPTSPTLKTNQIYSGAMADTLVSLYELQAVDWLYKHRESQIGEDEYEKAVYTYSQERLLEMGNQSLEKAIKCLQTSSQRYLAKATTLPWGSTLYHPSPTDITKVSNAITHSEGLRTLLQEGIDLTQPRLRETEDLWQRVKEGEVINPDVLFEILSVDEF